MQREAVLAFLKSNKSVFKAELGIIKVGLFGSLARKEKPNDIDIILEFEPGTRDLFGKKI
jgi:predicted nucleotidyltransferase